MATKKKHSHKKDGRSRRNVSGEGRAAQVRPDHAQLVSLVRSLGEPARRLGMVCRTGRALLLVHVVDDLRFDGYECLRTQDVVGVGHGRAERFAEKVLCLPDTLTRLEHPALPLDGVAVLLEALRARALIALECERDGDFLLGKLLRVNATSAVIHTIDAGGAWNRHATRLTLAEVTRVQFGDHYSRAFEAHAPTRLRPGSILDRSTR